ncbi:MAG: helicase-associated domain-containing protein, partial [Candidatus Competibacteraceae bacterium]|nr:helicase-associated domain-containing protein [Candidatus Competibacteraceae bacterium]
MSDYLPQNPLIVQSDQTVLLEVHSPRVEAARDALAPFAELVKSPEHIHTYRITPLSIWNARAAGLSAGAMIAVLREYAKYPIPEGVAQEIEGLGRRYGLTVIERDEIGLILRVADAPLTELLARDRQVAPLLGERLGERAFRIRLGVRGLLKQALVAIGYPADDLAGYSAGQELPLRLREIANNGEAFTFRDYQWAAAATFHQDGQAQGG